MLKQKIFPTFFKNDLINSEMPVVFLDPTAKIQIYLYETNQIFDQIFLDESDPTIRIVEFKLHSKLDAWLAQNFTKQINPFQNASAAKTIAMQTEIEMYITQQINQLIENKFYFFTFEPVTEKNINTISKYLIKETVDNLDRKKFRFSKIKAWLLSSVLIKNFQYWKFIMSAAELARKKIKKLTVKIDSASWSGNLRLEGNDNPNLAPQELNYSLNSFNHPYESLEPIAVHFSYKNNNLYSQLIHWDHFGKSQQQIRNTTFSIGTINQWSTVDFTQISYGSVAYMAGAIFGSPAPTGVQLGLAEQYCSELKDKANDLKQYMWAKEAYFNRNQREYWNLKKTRSTSSQKFIEEFLKNSNATGEFNPWWNPEWDTGYLGELFYSFNMPVMNDDNFNPSNEIINLPEAAEGNYCWCLGGAINFYNIGIFKKRTSNQNTLVNPDYYNFGVFPQNFISPNKIRTMLNEIRINKKLNEIVYNIDLEKPTFLNKIKLNIVLSDYIKIELFDEDNNKYDYETYTNFYLIGQDQITTTINFF